MGLWPYPRAGLSLDGQSIEQSPTPDIAARRRFVPESMAVFSDLTVKENLTCAARRTLDDTRRVDFRLLPRAQAFLAVARRRAVRRTEADASIARAIANRASCC